MMMSGLFSGKPDFLSYKIMACDTIKFPINSKVMVVKYRPGVMEHRHILKGYVYRVVDNEYGIYILNCPVDVTFFEDEIELVD